MKRWFAFDIMIIALDWVGVMHYDHSDTLRSATVMHGLRLIRFIRLLRIIKIAHLVNAIRLRINSQCVYMVTGIVQYLSLLVLINHLIACTWFWIGTEFCTAGRQDSCWVDKYGFRERTFAAKYVASYHWSLTQFTPASMQV